MKSLPLVAALACGLAAQDPSPVKSPAPDSPLVGPPAESAPSAPPRLQAADKPIVQAGMQALAEVFASPDFVAFDEPTDGPIWAVGQTWKAAFAEDGWRFVGKPAPGAQELQPIAFRLHGVTVGAETLAVAPAAPERRDRTITYRHGDAVQRIAVTGQGVEQTFTLDRLPIRDEVVVTLDVTTALAGRQDGAGIRFEGSHDQVTYSGAVAVDARGQRVAAPTTWNDGTITIRVPAGFVQRAALPLVIDPWVTAIQVYAGTSDIAEPDIAWDETGQVWAITMSRFFGATDWDCYVQRVARGNPMTLVGGLTVIDASTDGWQLPRIANLRTYSVFLVVAQVRSGSLPRKIWGRLMANSGPVVTNPILIYGSTVDELRPDVGGNQSPGPNGAFTVVWEHAFSATDHDIYARQVDATGALRSINFVQTNTAHQTWPSISKSAGSGTEAQQCLGVVYQQTGAAGDQDVYGRILGYNGVSLTPAFPLSTSSANDILPQVSSPTLMSGSRRFLLAVYQRTSSNAGDICATAFDQTGTVVASGNISALEQSPVRLTWPQHRPAVDCDGLRFVVAYHEVFNGNTTVNDLDTRVSLVDLAGNSLMVVEGGVALAFSGNREFQVQVATRYSGTGGYSREACTVNDRDNITSGFATDAYSYDGIPAGTGFATRATGCGSLSLSPSGEPAPGGTVGFFLQSSPNLAGFVVGLQASIPVGPCAGCTLGAQGGTVLGTAWAWSIPLDPGMLGTAFAVQAFEIRGTGPCLGAIHLSDTIDVTVR